MDSLSQRLTTISPPPGTRPEWKGRALQTINKQKAIVQVRIHHIVYGNRPSRVHECTVIILIAIIIISNLTEHVFQDTSRKGCYSHLNTCALNRVILSISTRYFSHLIESLG